MARMNVLRRRESAKRTVCTASSYHRYFRLKVNPAFQNRLAAKIWREIGLSCPRDFLLSFAIVAKIGGFSHGRVTDFIQSNPQFVFVSDEPKGRDRISPRTPEKPFKPSGLANIEEL